MKRHMVSRNKDVQYVYGFKRNKQESSKEVATIIDKPKYSFLKSIQRSNVTRMKKAIEKLNLNIAEAPIRGELNLIGFCFILNFFCFVLYRYGWLKKICWGLLDFTAIDVKTLPCKSSICTKQDYNQKIALWKLMKHEHEFFFFIYCRLGFLSWR